VIRRLIIYQPIGWPSRKSPPRGPYAKPELLIIVTPCAAGDVYDARMLATAEQRQERVGHAPGAQQVDLQHRTSSVQVRC